ncbi:MAG: molybdopterin oxidoreductase family protein [Proteobacteria bacterium]|nr:molybdopterin oxidoreductase family protein [Pseudomonadota bacterium]
MAPLDSDPRWRRTACPHDCPSTCALEVECLDERHIGKVRGNALNDYTSGVICAKVAAYRERVHHPDRLTTPLLRNGPKGSGQFQPIGWDEALDRVADAFIKASAKHGKETVWPYHFAGTMGLVQRDIIHGFRHALGYSREDETICVATASAGWIAGAGKIWGADPREMADADMIVIWGGNPVATQVNVMTHVAKGRKQRGAKLYVVDTYRTPTADAADVFLCLRPGTDGALAAAVMHVMFRDDTADWDYMRKYTDDPDGLAEHLKSKTPEWASTITGLSVIEIEAFAKAYGATDRAYIRVGYGFTRSRNGSANIHAVSCLPAVGGKWKYKGGGALHSNRNMFGVNQTLVRALDRLDTSIRALDMSRIGPILLGDEASLLGGPPVTAMIVQNVNPAEVAPELNKVLKGLAREDLFLCVHEQFMTPTAAMADIVLPATTFLEHEDLYQGGGHMYLQPHRALIEPVGQSRCNVDVLAGIARRLGNEHEVFKLSPWEIIDRTLRASGHPGADEVDAVGWVDCTQSFEKAHFLNGFPNPDGKFRFRPKWFEIGKAHANMPTFPDHQDVIDNATQDRPFRLVAAPARRFLNTSFTETPSSVKKEGRPTVLMHPDACQKLGIKDGDRVTLGNELGEVTLHARPFDGVLEDVVIVEGIWPNRYFENGIGINALISADRAYPNGGAVFHDTAIWVRPAGGGGKA